MSATALSLGTAIGGWRIMQTMGHRVVELEPIHGFAAETTAASIIYTGAHFGIPVSTTQVISSAIMGVGASRGIRGVRWGVARRILFAWVLTIPAAGVVRRRSPGTSSTPSASDEPRRSRRSTPRPLHPEAHRWSA